VGGLCLGARTVCPRQQGCINYFPIHSNSLLSKKIVFSFLDGR